MINPGIDNLRDTHFRGLELRYEPKSLGFHLETFNLGVGFETPVYLKADLVEDHN